jgi:hypothetical protein
MGARRELDTSVEWLFSLGRGRSWDKRVRRLNMKRDDKEV